MDLSSLQSLQSLQLAAGLMAFPPHTDPKQTAANTAAASMLPLMLPTMGGLPNMAAALPNMFSLGGLFGGNLAAAATTSSNSVSVAAGNRNGTMEAEGGNGEEALLAKRKREEEEKEEGENGDELGEDEEEAEGNEEGVTKAKKRKMEDGAVKVEKSVSGAAPKLPVVDSSAEVSINGDAAALLAAAGMSANSLAFNPFLLSTMAPGLLYPSMFLPPGLAGLSLSGFPTASTLAELQSAMAGAMGDGTPTPNPPRDEEEDTREGVKSTEEEEEGDEGAERDLAEEDGGAEGGATGAFEHPALDKGGVEEEAAVSPKKSTTD